METSFVNLLDILLVYVCIQIYKLFNKFQLFQFFSFFDNASIIIKQRHLKSRLSAIVRMRLLDLKVRDYSVNEERRLTPYPRYIS